MDDWRANATAMDGVTVDIGFIIAQTFYHGPENGFTREQWETLREPVYAPKIPRYGDYALTRDAADADVELVAYAEDVVRLCRKHDREPAHSSCFWLRPLVFKRGSFAIVFPWYDTYEEAWTFLNALAETAPRFSDQDQGWEVRVESDDDRLLICQRDPDADRTHIAVSTPLQDLRRQAPAVVERTTRLIARLTQACGHDYWSVRDGRGPWSPSPLTLEGDSATE